MTLKVIGHRGNGRTFDSEFAAGKAQENTLASFQQAYDNGADGIEFDIFVTKDKVRVVFAQDTLPDGTSISTYSYEELMAHQETMGLDIPTLAETLDLVSRFKGDSPEDLFALNIELKGTSVVEPSVEILQHYIEGGVISPSQLLFSSFDWDKLSLVTDLIPGAKAQPTIATVHLFSKEDVNMPGYFVGLKATYNRAALGSLDGYISTHEATAAIDTPTGDIRPELISFAEERNIGFCTHPTGPRRVDEAPRLYETIRLIDEFASRAEVDVFFKVDDIQAAREVIEDARQGQPCDVEKLERVGGVKFLRQP